MGPKTSSVARQGTTRRPRDIHVPNVLLVLEEDPSIEMWHSLVRAAAHLSVCPFGARPGGLQLLGPWRVDLHSCASSHQFLQSLPEGLLVHRTSETQTCALRGSQDLVATALLALPFPLIFPLLASWHGCQEATNHHASFSHVQSSPATGAKRWWPT